MYRRMYREGRIVSVLLVCDRCRPELLIDVNAMPAGWLRWPLGWPGHEQDVCEHCLTPIEEQALADEPIEARDDR